MVRPVLYERAFHKYLERRRFYLKVLGDEVKVVNDEVLGPSRKRFAAWAAKQDAAFRAKRRARVMAKYPDYDECRKRYLKICLPIYRKRAYLRSRLYL